MLGYCSAARSHKPLKWDHLAKRVNFQFTCGFFGRIDAPCLGDHSACHFRRPSQLWSKLHIICPSATMCSSMPCGRRTRYPFRATAVPFRCDNIYLAPTGSWISRRRSTTPLHHGLRPRAGRYTLRNLSKTSNFNRAASHLPVPFHAISRRKQI